jgi:hypothetical protein
MYGNTPLFTVNMKTLSYWIYVWQQATIYCEHENSFLLDIASTSQDTGTTLSPHKDIAS